MKRLLYWLTVIAATLSYGLLLTAPAIAATTLQGDDLRCKTLMSATDEVTDMQKAGVPWDVYLPYLNRVIAVAMGDPDSIVQNEDDAEYIRKAFKRRYDDPTSGEAIYQACMAGKSGMRKQKMV